MSPLILWAGAIGMFIGLVVGAAIGLYAGERGRRRAAENMAAHGTPDRPRARSIPQPVSAEQRAEDQRYSRATIEKGAEHLMKMAETDGRKLSRKDALRQAESMLHNDAPAEMGGL